MDTDYGEVPDSVKNYFLHQLLNAPDPFERFYEEAPRTLWERLFSWPWRPFKKTKMVLKKKWATQEKTNAVKFRRYPPIVPQA